MRPLPWLSLILLRHYMLVLGLWLDIISLAALLAPLLAPYNPLDINVKSILNSAPSWTHIMGTDALGRDILSRILWSGGRVSLWVGFVAVGISTAIGLFLSLVAGYYGQFIDEIVMRGMVIGLTSWMGIARIIKAETFSLTSRDFILSARGVAAGAGPTSILLRHILPNVLAPVCLCQPTWT